jgi:outer membrane receptor for Fe3+-dicitrate
MKNWEGQAFAAKRGGGNGRRHAQLVVLTSVMGLMGIHSRARADSLATPASPADSDIKSVLSTVIVTAQRRSENLQSVPISVTALNASQLTRSGVADVQQLSLVVPGLNVQNANGYATPYIRGVGSSAVGPGIENPVALYVDGVYYAAPSGSLLSFNQQPRPAPSASLQLLALP